MLILALPNGLFTLYHHIAVGHYLGNGNGHLCGDTI